MYRTIVNYNFEIVFLALGYTFALFAITISSFSLLNKKTTKEGKTYFYQAVDIQSIFNANLGNYYVDIDTSMQNDKFSLTKNSYVFDTDKNIRYYLPESKNIKAVELILPEPIKNIKSLFFLINAGNGIEKGLGEKIGSIELLFSGGLSKHIELILGKNVRDWSPGNMSKESKLVIQTTDSQNTLFGKSINYAGRYAVIDQLEIPLDIRYRELELSKIIFRHQRVYLPNDSTIIQYMIYGITVEIEPPTKH